MRNLKTKLKKSNSEWAKDLSSILWAYHATSRISMGEMPYSMVYETESIILVEIRMPSFRTSNFDKENNEAELRLNLDLLDKKRERVEVCQADFKHQVAKYYNQRVKNKSSLPGYLILMKLTMSTKKPYVRKLDPT